VNGALLERKQAELEAKRRALTIELQFWRDESEERRPMEKHHSQIRRIATRFESALATLQEEIADAVRDHTLLDQALTLETLIIDLHRVWDFFRSKLLPRTTGAPFHEFLDVADDLAWAFYEPAINAARVPDLKQPPLTFFHDATSPAALARNYSYRSFVGPEQFSNVDAEEILKSLPVPVIGLPWFQTGHLPDILVIAHEVGHHVEDDLQLTQTLRNVVTAAAPAEHQEAWLAWAGELFADVYATIAAGPPFTRSLAAFLSSGSAAVAAETQSSGAWSSYPTSYLRMLARIAVLEADETLAAAAQEIENDWRTENPAHSLESWEQECRKVAKAVAAGPYPIGGRELALRDVISFSGDSYTRACADRDNVRRSRDAASADVRELAGAAALLFHESPAVYGTPDAYGTTPRDRLMSRIHAIRRMGVRASARVPAATQQIDFEAGRDLLARLRRS
jgi:hypothetical protein